jgi:hypothetical protein
MECSFNTVRFGNYSLINFSPVFFNICKLLDTQELGNDKYLTLQSLKRQCEASASPAAIVNTTAERHQHWAKYE